MVLMHMLVKRLRRTVDLPIAPQLGKASWIRLSTQMSDRHSVFLCDSLYLIHDWRWSTMLRKKEANPHFFCLYNIE